MNVVRPNGIVGRDDGFTQADNSIGARQIDNLLIADKIHGILSRIDNQHRMARIGLESANVCTVRRIWVVRRVVGRARSAALVGSEPVGGASIYGRAGGQQSVRLGRTSVVGQWAEQRILPDDVVGAMSDPVAQRTLDQVELGRRDGSGVQQIGTRASVGIVCNDRTA